MTGVVSDDLWAPLRAAVPSFAERWRAFASSPWYEADASFGVSELARHMVDEVAANRVGEVAPFFAALEDLLAVADEELYNVLTIGLLEDLVHEADRRGISLAVFDKADRGAASEAAWVAVLAFTRGRHPE